MSVVATVGPMELGHVERLAFHRGKPRLLLTVQHAGCLGKLFLAKFAHFAEAFAAVLPTSFVPQFRELLGIFVMHGGKLFLLGRRQTKLASDAGIVEGARTGHLDGNLPEPGLLRRVKQLGHLAAELLVHVVENLGPLRAHFAETLTAIVAGRVRVSLVSSTCRLNLRFPFRVHFSHQFLDFLGLFWSQTEVLLNGLVSQNEQRRDAVRHARVSCRSITFLSLKTRDIRRGEYERSDSSTTNANFCNHDHLLTAYVELPTLLRAVERPPQLTA